MLITVHHHGEVVGGVPGRGFAVVLLVQVRVGVAAAASGAGLEHGSLII